MFVICRVCGKGKCHPACPETSGRRKPVLFRLTPNGSPELKAEDAPTKSVEYILPSNNEILPSAALHSG
jgi:hypothetical protein